MSIYKKRPWESVLTAHLPNLPGATAKMIKDLMRFLGEQDVNLSSLLNQGLRFSDNFNATELSFTTNATPDTQDAVVHGRGSAPTRFVVLDQDKGGVLYRSAAFDATNCYFKNTAASVAMKILVF